MAWKWKFYYKIKKNILFLVLPIGVPGG